MALIAPVLQPFVLPQSTTATIASGAITVTQGLCNVEVQSGVTDDLATLSGGVDGQLVYLSSATGWPIVVKHNVGNLLLASGTDVTLDAPSDTLTLRYSASLAKWLQVFVADVPSWSLYDAYTTSRAAGAVNGTASEPTGGVRVVVDTESKLSIA